MKYLRLASACFLQLFAYLLGFAGFVGTFFGGAKFIDKPFVLIVSGLFVSMVLCLSFSLISAKLLRFGKARRYSFYQGIAFIVILLICVWGFIIQPLVPVNEQYVRVVPDGVEYWELSTGSRIAVRKISAQGISAKTPIVVIHGGPGSYAVGLEQTWQPISKLSEAGHDVYFYDQIGGGLSDRLDDISQYSLERQINDLDAIYQKIGSEQLILIGSSFGATLTANYMARYPKNVSHAVFSGAGAIYLPDWTDGSDGSLDTQMTEMEREEFNKSVNQPRLITAIILSEINPKAAVNFLPSQEAGSFFDKVANDHYMPFTVCNSNNVDTKTAGFGFWSNRMTSKTLANRRDDPKPALRDSKIPVLILRGKCDYKSEVVSRQYASVFPNSDYVEHEDAGHMFYWEKPNFFVETVLKFLE